MRIPLDYYRILGVPLQATAEQIEQAYGDRAVQQPRPEYSPMALAARKALLDTAYAVLSDPERRTAYDASFLMPASATEETDSSVLPAPSLEIDREHLVGALSIWQELGEYESLCHWAEPLLETGEQNEARRDAILSVALASWEWGRERWQQRQYEAAAAIASTGHDLLEREDLFPQIRRDISTELYRLRPYRILELLSRPDRNLAATRKALQLLQEMLDERGGIDGSGDDRSGLGIDDFLRFIQQLRGYLTAKQQQELFEWEAQRPSAVATYLAANAKIARGFAEREPAAIASALTGLQQLGQQQDVYLEQAVCALLVGETTTALAALECSGEAEPLDYIRKRSQEAPDLLPGLCSYAEHWLQTQVMPKFRDLANQRASLQAYFSDRHVRAEIERLSAPQVMAEPATRQVEWESASARRVRSLEAEAYEPTEAIAVGQSWSIPPTARSGAATVERATSSASVMSPSFPTTRGSSSHLGGPARERQGRSSRRSSPRARYRERSPESRVVPFKHPSDPDRTVPAAPPQRQRLTKKRVAAQRRRRLLFLGTTSALGAGLLAWIAIAVISSGQQEQENNTAVATGTAQLALQLDRAPIAIPSAEEFRARAEGMVTPDTAETAIATWLEKKSQAFGVGHQINALDEILAEPLLSRQRSLALGVQQEEAYRQFQHQIAANSVRVEQEEPETAIVEATVREVADFYRSGQRVSYRSYDSTLRVRYSLQYQSDRWKISNIEVVEKLR